MENNKGLGWGSNFTLTQIVTIDDLQNIAQLLVKGLHELGNYKYPFALRKGVNFMTDKNVASKTIKAGAQTFFLDIKKTKKGKPYLVITESRFKGEGEDRERQSIAVFPENAKEFVKEVTAMTKKLG